MQSIFWCCCACTVGPILTFSIDKKETTYYSNSSKQFLVRLRLEFTGTILSSCICSPLSKSSTHFHAFCIPLSPLFNFSIAISICYLSPYSGAVHATVHASTNKISSDYTILCSYSSTFLSLFIINPKIELKLVKIN